MTEPCLADHKHGGRNSNPATSCGTCGKKKTGTGFFPPLQLAYFGFPPSSFHQFPIGYSFFSYFPPKLSNLSNFQRPWVNTSLQTDIVNNNSNKQGTGLILPRTAKFQASHKNFHTLWKPKINKCLQNNPPFVSILRQKFIPRRPILIFILILSSLLGLVLPSAPLPSCFSAHVSHAPPT